MKRAVFLVVLVLAMSSFALQANMLVVGDPPMLGTGNCDPFGCPGFFGLTTYQQVYLSSAFPGQISISGLSFYEGLHNGGTPAGGNFTLSFSYSTDAPGDLSLSNPNDNIASGDESFFSGALPSLTREGLQNVLVLNGTPFVYNPADGNLLVTVTVTGAKDQSPLLYLEEAACGPTTVCPPGSSLVTSNAYFGKANGGNTVGGLITGFDYTTITSSVPEPGSFLLILGGAGLVLYRRQRLS